MTDIVVVESPAKAKTINRYLGDGYKVLASYGHIRDLPSKVGSVRPDADFAMDWEIDAKARKHVNEIANAVKGADFLYLATDPDREGEAISWHVREVLDQKNLLDGVEVKRVVFNEITKNAILEAFANPRDLDKELVTRTWRAGRWTIWSALPCRRCCGANCPAAARRGACNRWRCA